MEHFVEEYAEYLLKEIDSNDLMRSEIKQLKIDRIKKTLTRCDRRCITINEAMKILSSI